MFLVSLKLNCYLPGLTYKNVVSSTFKVRHTRVSCWSWNFSLKSKLKNWGFLVKIVSLLKAIVCEQCWRFFVSVLIFARQKATIIENVTFSNYSSGIRIPGCSKLAINHKYHNGVTTYRYDIIVKIFWLFLVFSVRFCYWSKFHVNINTDSGVMTIFFCKGLTINPEIRNTPVWVLPNICRLGHVVDTKFGTAVSNKVLLNAAKCQGCSF